MAAVAPAADQATGLLRNISLDPKKTHEVPEVTNKVSVGGGSVPSVLIASKKQSVTPPLQDAMDQSMWYPSPAYCYGGYHGFLNELENYSRFINSDGLEVPPPGLYGDMYQHAYGYAPYGTYHSPGSPVPTIGHDGHLYGPQPYQYPVQYYQPPTPPPALSTPNQSATSKVEAAINITAEKPPATVDPAKAKSNRIANGKANGHIISGQHNCDGQQKPTTTNSSPAFSHVGNNPSKRNQNFHPFPHLMGLHASTSCMGPATPGFNGRIYGQCGTAFRTGLGFGYNGYPCRMNGEWSLVTGGKYKPQSRGNGFYGFGSLNIDGLSELNRGPRGGHLKNQKGFGPSITYAMKGQSIPVNGNADEAIAASAREQYNREDFPEKHSNVMCFVIKSYSEDDIHKSVKYNVWASTPNGNKKLDAAYREAQEKADKCPVFLFFSVNTSGQFVGVAEMVGPVDFSNTVEYWQQDKWNGCFPVKWHIVKDVPNSILKHITLQNNENKPVTNSRDTQEVPLEQGLQMLKLFKEHACKTSILDDFGFYESRQKIMQDKRAKQQFQKQVLNAARGAAALDDKEKDGADGKPRLQRPLEVVSILKKEANQDGHGEQMPPQKNGVAVIIRDVKHATENGVANAC